MMMLCSMCALDEAKAEDVEHTFQMICGCSMCASSGVPSLCTGGAVELEPLLGFIVASGLCDHDNPVRSERVESLHVGTHALLLSFFMLAGDTLENSTRLASLLSAMNCVLLRMIRVVVGRDLAGWLSRQL